jgi:hypothetical protein
MAKIQCLNADMMDHVEKERHKKDNGREGLGSRIQAEKSGEGMRCVHMLNPRL